ncbi:DUF5704 domain-containing protein [Anaerobium acetethylicum]|uniref:DUF5704 domain-containing protein n=1 Tax=Anaerobium acetethylicum TaxID=1619234 RepID=A0A1D3TXW2_9FIRM|nr:DUF5704 domain-containing protein [Anaerobium acetethylicum]SCP99224.1 hypothetical protein SAMN05421730_103519 [Anaerobium acetethylicum]
MKGKKISIIRKKGENRKSEGGSTRQGIKIAAALVLMSAFLFLSGMISYAVGIEDYYQEVLKFDDQGNLIMTVHDRKATAAVTYKTIGWTIKRYNQPIDAAGNQCARIVLEENAPSRPDPGDSKYIYSYFYCNRDAIFNSIGNASKEWQEELYSNGGTVYLDSIMTVCVNGVPRGSLTDGGAGSAGEVYFTFEGIAGARKWANPESLRTHFNKSLSFPENKEMLSGSFHVAHFEVAGEDYEHAASLERYGKNISGGVLEAREHSFTKEDFTEHFFEYRKLHVMLEYRDGRKYDYWTEGDQDVQGMAVIGNQDNSIERADVHFYYERVERQQERTDYFNWDQNGNQLANSLCIRAEEKGNEAFDVSEGVPTGEELYVEGKFSKYRYACRYKQTYGFRTYGIRVRTKYTLRWTGENGIVHEEEAYREKDYYADRYYSYWEVEDLDLNYLDNVEVCNYAFENGKVVLDTIPEAWVMLFTGRRDRMKDPEYAETLEVYGGIIEGGNAKPEIQEGNYQQEAEAAIGQITVKNDAFLLDNQRLLDNTAAAGTASEPVKPAGDITVNIYKGDILIPHTKRNGEKYPSTATANYGTYGSISEESFRVMPVNGITVHTPVVCQGMISSEKEFNQEINPDRMRASLILGRSFIIRMGTTGVHKKIKGYGYRDYDEYTDCGQVRFPFTVYRGEGMIDAGTWIDIEGSNMFFYLPEGISEGDYAVEFRAAAKNYDTVEGGLDKIEQNANLNRDNYAAWDSVKVRVTGRLFGFSIIDIGDYPRWERVFRKGDGITPRGFAYRVGTQDKNGNSTGISEKYSLPILRGGHPYNLNAWAVRTGYHIKFKLTTIGTMAGNNDYIHLTPEFWYVDKNGRNRQKVDLYYSAVINGSREEYVKIGSAVDKTNVMTLDMSSRYSLAPKEELEKSAELTGQNFKDLYGEPAEAYTFGNILLSYKSRNFIGNTTKNISDSNAALKSRQEWYGEYHLPAKIHAVPEGFDLKQYIHQHGTLGRDSKFFLKDGYILVNLNIETLKNRVPSLSYTNLKNAASGYCNMWKREGFAYSRTDALNVKFAFIDGDAFLYDLDASLRQDYKGMGTH